MNVSQLLWSIFREVYPPYKGYINAWASALLVPQCRAMRRPQSVERATGIGTTLFVFTNPVQEPTHKLFIFTEMELHIKKMKLIGLLLVVGVWFPWESVFADTTDNNENKHDFDYYKTKIIMNVMMAGDEEEQIENRNNMEKRKDSALANALSLCNSRFTQTLATSAVGNTSIQDSIDGNTIYGIAYYNDADGHAMGYGSELCVKFKKDDCECTVKDDIENFGPSSFPYLIYDDQVYVSTPSHLTVIKMPYPLPAHIFKSELGDGSTIDSRRTVETLLLPTFDNKNRDKDEVLYENLKGKKFIGYARNDQDPIHIKNGVFGFPLMFTVVEFRNDGYLTICNPASSKVVEYNGKYAVSDGKVYSYEIDYSMSDFIKDFPDLPSSYYDQAKDVFKNYYHSIGNILNNGNVINLQGTFVGNVFMVTEN